MTPAKEQQKQLISVESAVSMRQPKTDRLIIKRLLIDETRDMRLESQMQNAHPILIKWADLESSGRLATLNETQMQGDFLTQVFGEALGYVSPLENKEAWNRVQHHAIVAGQTPDAVLGNFATAQEEISAVVELKGPLVHLDRNRSNGRTAVDQCWDYLVNTPPTCRWGIVTNIVSFRLYERNSTKRAYEHFTLQSLRDFDVFKQFYVLFQRDGLIASFLQQTPRAAKLLKDSSERKRHIGNELYETYSSNRTDLISFLYFKEKHPLEAAIEMTQRLFDRIMFIAFCEDRHLLPQETIQKASRVDGFQAVTNPRWNNFKNLFHFIDKGNETYSIPKYNGGLFAKHPVDDLELPDNWTEFFSAIASYDFSDEVNLDVLGHIFERSITELEKLKESGLFGGSAEKTDQYARMPQSAQRKQLGTYYTPPELTSRIVQYTVEELINQRFAAAASEYGVSAADAARGIAPEDKEYWQRCLFILQNLTIVDPACGSGAFLFQAYNTLELRYYEVIGHLEQAGEDQAKELFGQVPEFILQKNLYGVDLSAEAVEITQLALWIRSATPGHTLAKLSANIVHGNSLMHDDKTHAAGFDWKTRFRAVFEREESGFDCVIGNPPWERMKLLEREFFSFSAPEIATATNAAIRAKLIEKLKSEQPKLFESYQQAMALADSLLTYCRKSGEYPLTGQGDINMYAVFAELASQLVAPHGRVGLLVPSGIASDMTTKDFFSSVADSNRLIRLYDFENKKVFFPEVHPSFRFCILNFAGHAVLISDASFVFFAHQVEELEDSKRHITLSSDDIRLLNPNTRTCPIFVSRRDAEIAKAIYHRIAVLIDHNRKGPTGNLWGTKFKRMFDQTNDAELFHEPDTLKAEGFSLKGSRWGKGKQAYLPLYEAKMFRPYDHRFGTVFEDTTNWINQGQTTETDLAQHQNPEFLVLPRWWVLDSIVEGKLAETKKAALVGFRDVTRATDSRTFLATIFPRVGFTNKVPLVITNMPMLRDLCLLANFNSMPLDYCTRQKFGGISLNFFIVEQLPVLSPDTYDKPCPWNKKTTLESWISERVLKLTCTAEDMLPLAETCGFMSGSFKAEYGGKLNKWDDAERAELMAELDAAFFHLYGISEDDARYILSTFNGIQEKQEGLFAEHCSMAERVMQKYADLVK